VYLACIRKVVLGRLEELGLRILRLPVGATEQDKHVPILVSADLAEKKRIIVLFPEREFAATLLNQRHSL
jgi:hypothetical protein